MAGNSFGTLFKLTTFGESHGKAIGGIIDGCPAGLELDIDAIQKEMQRRRPGQSEITTSRSEQDEVEFYSGIFEGKTTGTPIGFFIGNKDQRSKDYGNLRNEIRPSHADYTWQEKFGHRDFRGGGRSSARETAVRVAAGAIAKQLLAHEGIKIQAYVSQVGALKSNQHYATLDFNKPENIVRCPDETVASEMIASIEAVKKEGDTLGGVVTCFATGVPVGWGEPVFDKLHAKMGMAMLSINAVKGFEYGSGFQGATLKGSEHNDLFEQKDGEIRTTTNLSGGVQGGISNGEDIYFNVAFKPVATIMKPQSSVDVKGTPIELRVRGRHDPCVVPRAVPIVEAMTALVLADFYLLAKGNKIES